MGLATTLAAGVLVLGYAVVNAFGAWAVVRRRSSIGAAFFGAAVLLTIGAVAIGFALPAAMPLVAAGAATASLASWWNARAFLGRVVPRRHAVRALVGALATALAFWVTRG